MAGHTAQSGTGFDLEQFLPYRLHRLAQRLSADFFERSAGDFDGGFVEWCILSALVRQSGTTARDIAASTGLGKATVSRAISTLEHQGLVLRSRDGSDRRVERLHASEAGSARLATISACGSDYERFLGRIAGLAEVARLVELVTNVEADLICGLGQEAP
nr:MarR family winged helix-turn-helix transcriptional regulator [uncultured Gellertiella sp.]